MKDPDMQGQGNKVMIHILNIMSPILFYHCNLHDFFMNSNFKHMIFKTIFKTTHSIEHMTLHFIA